MDRPTTIGLDLAKSVFQVHGVKATARLRGGPRLSSAHEARLLISVLAYQMMHIARRGMARATGTGCSLRRLQQPALCRRSRRAGPR